MRNPSPFVLNLRIILFFQSIVFLVQVSVELIEKLAGQNLTFLVSLVDSMLKLSKLGLTEDCTSEAVQEVIEDSKAGSIVLYFFQELLCQDVFIGCRSNLS